MKLYVLTRIKEVRKEKGITQEKIANMIGMNQTQYSRYERGENEIKVNVLIDICKALQVSSDYILELTDDPTPRTPSKNIKNNIEINFGNVNMN